VALSLLRYHYQHCTRVEAVVQAGAGRDAAFDTLAAGVGKRRAWRAYPQIKLSCVLLLTYQKPQVR
jgi:hypothetical protein